MNMPSKIVFIIALLISSLFSIAPLYAMRAACAEDNFTLKMKEMQKIITQPDSVEKLQKYLKENPEAANSTDMPFDDTLLHYIVNDQNLENHTALIDTLIGNDFTKINYANGLGNTASHIIAENALNFFNQKKLESYKEIIITLIKAQADFNLKNKQALHKSYILMKTKAGTPLQIIQATQAHIKTLDNDSNHQHALLLEQIINFIKDPKLLEPSQLQKNFEAFSISGNNANVYIKTFKAAYPMHTEILSVRCPSLFKLLN